LKRIVVVGGGIAGLATAVELSDLAPAGTELLVLESGDRLGGNIRTEHEDGFTVEWGPNGYLDNVPATAALIKRIGLQDAVQPANERAAKRFLFRDGKLHELAASPLKFFASPVLSVAGRLRLLGEPFARSRPEGVDESVGAFATRRIGAEAASVLVDAMVSGVFAGDVNRLSLASAFPKMAKMEAEHGSLVKAMIASGKAKKRATKGGGGPTGPGGTLTSFKNGLGSFIARLEEELDSSVRLRTPVRAVERNSESGTWIVRTDSDEILADAVVLSLPGHHAASILEPLDHELGAEVGKIPTAPLAVVALAFDAQEIGGDPDGFGFLVPRGQGPRILGCLWDSSLFPGRAPQGKVLLRAMIGGAHDPEAVEMSDEALLVQVRSDLETTMGLSATPIRSWIFRHPVGISQYDVGHGARLERIEARVESHPGLWLAGSSYYGVAMNLCIENAGKQARAIVDYLKP
jgi:oxygen-dependent protoporphyrinogen oxidase